MKVDWTFRWRNRDGGQQRVSFMDTEDMTFEQAKERARAYGWPGHTGSPWNYFKDDLRNFRKSVESWYRIIAG